MPKAQTVLDKAIAVIDGDLPAHLIDPGPVGTPLGPEAFYDDPGAAAVGDISDATANGPADDGPTPPEADGEPAAATADSQTGSEATTAKADAEAKKPDAEADKPGWDKVRQEKDQEIAGLRKELAAVKAKTETEAETPAKTGDADDADDTEIDLDALNEALGGDGAKPLEPLGEYATDEEVKERLNLLTKRELARQTAREVTDNRKAFNSVLNECCAEVGEGHRNAIVAAVKKQWDDAGYDAEHYPDAAATRNAVLAVGRKLALDAAKSAPPTPTPKPKPAAPLDPVGGGIVPDRLEISQAGLMTVEETMEQMIADGEVEFAK